MQDLTMAKSRITGFPLDTYSDYTRIEDYLFEIRKGTAPQSYTGGLNNERTLLFT